MATKTVSIRNEINNGDPAVVGTAAVKLKLGNQLSKIKAVFTGLTSLAAQPITNDEHLANGTLTGVVLDPNENLPAIGQIVSVRVTAGTAATGARFVGDAGATPSTTIVTLSDDGVTLTFEAAVTAYVIQYYPAPAVSLDNTLAS